jgi:hypothetical protein
MTASAEYNAMWKKLKAHFTEVYKKRNLPFPGWAKISWLDIYLEQEACGYPLTREQEKMIGR